MVSRDKFAFVLFKPQSAGNIGAAARALKNMGFDDLRLVAPGTLNQREAVAMAVHADDVLASATTYHDLASALADCSRSPSAPPAAAAAAIEAPRSRFAPAALELAGLSHSNKIALIFGREDRGLTNRELKLCNRLITIPTAPEYPSLNLAQAVVVVAYELMMATSAPVTKSAAREFVSASSSDAMLARMADALVSIGFLSGDNPDHIMFALREIFGRSGLTPREVEILNGMARQMRWAAEGGSETIAAKRKAGKKLR